MSRYIYKTAFKRFLKEKNILKLFEKYYATKKAVDWRLNDGLEGDIQVHLDWCDVSDYVSRAFPWSYTAEGDDYWSDISHEWERIVGDYWEYEDVFNLNKSIIDNDEDLEPFPMPEIPHYFLMPKLSDLVKVI